jgi:hypothetical protein
VRYECLGNLKYDLLLTLLNAVIFDAIGILWEAFLCDEMMIYKWWAMMNYYYLTRFGTIGTRLIGLGEKERGSHLMSTHSA